MELIMSTLALRAAGLFASAVEHQPAMSFVARLLAARENEAWRRVVGYLAVIDDARLQGLGFSGEDIAALRAGQPRRPG
jgi:hypothetical protein